MPPAGLYFSESGSLPAGIVELARRLEIRDPDFRLVHVSRTSSGVEEVDVIVDGEGRVFEGYGARDGTFYLLRPDRHVAARWLSPEAAEVESALCAALGGGKR